MKLQNKVVIVTGASSGMGRATALLFVEEGAKVIALARRKERLEELESIAAGKGLTIVPFAADLAVDADIEAAVKLAVDRFGGLDVLVNNAGIMDNMVPLHELTDEHWDRILNLNLTSLMKMSRAALKVMLPKKSGVIVNIASIGGLQGTRAGVAYAASKHGVIGLTKNVGFMYANEGIRCNAICPGGVNTEIAAAGVNSPSEFGMARATAGMAANPRSGEPEEIATAALFLACDDSSFINGTTLVADAGWTAY